MQGLGILAKQIDKVRGEVCDVGEANCREMMQQQAKEKSVPGVGRDVFYGSGSLFVFNTNTIHCMPLAVSIKNGSTNEAHKNPSRESV